MSSGTSAVRDVLAGYLAGRIPAERLAAVVAAAYYGEGGRGKREGLGPVIEVIERRAPGAVELVRAGGGAGFEIRPGLRIFTASDDAELRAAVETVLRGRGKREGGRVLPSPGLFTRLVRAIRRLLS